MFERFTLQGEPQAIASRVGYLPKSGQNPLDSRSCRSSIALFFATQLPKALRLGRKLGNCIASDGGIVMAMKKCCKRFKVTCKKAAKHPKKQSPKSLSFTISVLGGTAILRRVRRGFQLQVSPTGEDDPQGGCVTVFPVPRYPGPLPEDYKVWTL